MSGNTLEYYNKNAASFAAGTQNADMTAAANRFLSYLPDAARILDFGCGSGRDTRYFLDRGYQVEAVDGSAELCKMATTYTGIVVRHMLFSELNERERYDGIWACASILHIPSCELPAIIRKMAIALKEEGICYVSFKYGSFEGERNGRYFTDRTEESFGSLIRDIPEFHCIKTWISTDVRPRREEEKWLNIILKKQASPLTSIADM